MDPLGGSRATREAGTSGADPDIWADPDPGIDDPVSEKARIRIRIWRSQKPDLDPKSQSNHRTAVPCSLPTVIKKYHIILL